MPSLQELLVSYAVKIDESGVSRLHTLLDQNRKKAADTAAAFAALESGVGKLGKVLEQFTKRYPHFGLSGQSYRLVSHEASLLEGGARRPEGVASLLEGGGRRPEGVSSDTGQRTRELSRFASVLSESIRSSVSAVTNRPNTYTAGGTGTGSFALHADTSPVQEAIDDLTRFIASKTPTMRMKGDASGLITAASNAAGRVKSILSDVKIDLHNSGTGKSSPSSSVMQFSSVGGRFDTPTTTQVAEDGDTEYIIPVRKEKKAIPLIMQMMGELSFSAYQSVLAQLGVQHSPASLHEGGGRRPEGVASLFEGSGRTSPPSASLLEGGGRRAEGVLSLSPLAPEGINSAPSLSSFAAGLSIQNHYDISAPCTIQVHSTGTDAKQVGEAAYNAAERQLLKSIRGVLK